MKYQAKTMDIFDKTKLEAAAADAAALVTADEKLAANIDYLAMMTDVELPEEEEETGNE